MLIYVLRSHLLTAKDVLTFSSTGKHQMSPLYNCYSLVMAETGRIPQM
jgi:hypothetical protein